jgi:hypothetical protein
MPLAPSLTENDFRELFLALRRDPQVARLILEELRKDAGHLRYEPALLAARRQGTTLRELVEDFSVSRSLIGQLQARFHRKESREQEAIAAMQQDPGEGPLSLPGLDERTTKALKRVRATRSCVAEPGLVKTPFRASRLDQESTRA